MPSRFASSFFQPAAARSPFLTLLWPLLPALVFANGASARDAGVSAEPTLPAVHERMGMTLAAKRLCSAVFVSERDAEEAFERSAGSFLPESAVAARESGELRFHVDRDARQVVAAWRGARSKAGFFGSQGCVILPPDVDTPFFNPVAVESELPPAESQDWPMGDRDAVAPERELEAWGVDTQGLEAALDVAFSESAGETVAFLVVHRGKIVAERYGSGAHADMQLESWSMGKSLTAALVGVLIEQGRLALDAPARVPVWRARANDARGKITLRQLLNMSSGLRMTSTSDSPELLAESFVPGWPDHAVAYAMPVDAFEFAESRKLEFPPGTVGRYRNVDPLVVGSIIRRTVESQGEDYLRWPQEVLFDRIGIRRQVLETDAYGNFVLTGFDYGTARNWARLGMLFLNRGEWLGERIIPADFVDFVSSPAPAWEDDNYGGQFWLKSDTIPLAEDYYYMSGVSGQQVFIVPAKDAVVLRMGHTGGFDLEASQRRTEAVRLATDALPDRP